MGKINFYKRYKFFYLRDVNFLKEWIIECVKKEGKKIGNLDFIFCSDRQLLKENIEHLGHDTFTDVITFDYSSDKEILEGEILISIERVRDNAKKYNKIFEDELHLVMIHGVIHLMGYNDLSHEEKKIMEKKEALFLKSKKM